jgi:hypothetical protein
MFNTLTEFLNAHGGGIHCPNNENNFHPSFHGHDITWADEPLAIHEDQNDDNDTVACKYF